MSTNEPILVARPSWWNYWGWLLFAWLLVPFGVAWWKRRGLTLTILPDRIVQERGVLSKQVTDLFISDVRAVEVRQSLVQRMFRVGTVVIATAAGDASDEIVAPGMPRPLEIKDLVIARRQAMKKGSNE
jgi:uncharacterized membrane protein YdbT with pleckstrin-like domain